MALPVQSLEKLPTSSARSGVAATRSATSTKSNTRAGIWTLSTAVFLTERFVGPLEPVRNDLLFLTEKRESRGSAMAKSTMDQMSGATPGQGAGQGEGGQGSEDKSIIESATDAMTSAVERAGDVLSPDAGLKAGEAGAPAPATRAGRAAGAAAGGARPPRAPPPPA